MSFLELRHVSKTYGEGATEVHALSEINVSVEAGSLVAVMGSSGSGKSTLLTIAGSLEEPSAGQVLIGGADLSRMSRNERARMRRRSIGYVFQDYNLLAGLSAVENVSLPLELDGLSAKKAQLAGMAALDELGLADRAAHFPDQLSGGERQRVSIARAVVGERKLLLADEPSGALDSTNGEAVMRLVLEACRRGVAAVVVTHDAQLASWADRVIFLRDGRVVDQTMPPQPRIAACTRIEPMTTSVLDRPAAEPVTTRRSDGGVAARRAMSRWAWRLFRREWRQQFLILALVVVAVAATFVGAAVATNTPEPAKATFGTATNLISYQAPVPHLSSDLTALHRLFGPIDVIDNQTLSIPGSIDTYQLRSQDPHGAYGQPLISLISGRYPANADDVAVTQGVAAAFHLHVGQLWRENDVARRVVGIVQNPQSLLDEFALVVPGQVTTPATVTVLFDNQGARIKASSTTYKALATSGTFETVSSVTNNNIFNPSTVVLALATLGMVLIALVSVGGFTVLAQRRMRSIGMLGALGATDKHIRMVVRANGLVVGVVGTLVGALLGLVAWLAYRPHLQSSSHHLIAMFALPWNVIGPAMGLAVVATFLAAARPARTVTRVPIVTALAGRPAPPKRLHRSAVPGIIVGVIAFLLLTVAGSSHGGGGGPQLILGLVLLIAAVVLLSPLALAALARIGRRAPISVRLALRDLARYRSRSGSALAAISLGVLIAVMICVLAASRYGNVLDYAGPNMASNQVVIYPPGQGCGPHCSAAPTSETPAQVRAKVAAIAASLGTHDVVTLDGVGANLQHDGPGRQFSGQIYAATPQLLKTFGISATSIDSTAEVLTSRPGLAGYSDMEMDYSGNGKRGPSGGGQLIQPSDQGGRPPTSAPCPHQSCVDTPQIQEVPALPSGTSAPNTVVTEYAIHRFHLQLSPQAWLVQTTGPLSASQTNNARQAAAAAGLSIESKNDEPTSSEIINWATAFGIFLALGILGMTVGLLRSETASDLRILGATGASGWNRRSITAATGGALGLLGALLGIVAGYVACIAFLSGNSEDGLSSLHNIPLHNLLFIALGMPLIAALVGFVFSGREQIGMSRQPTE